MSNPLESPNTCQSLVLYDSSLDPRNLSARGCAKITEKASSQLVESDLVRTRLFSSDMVPKTTANIKALTIRKLDLLRVRGDGWSCEFVFPRLLKSRSSQAVSLYRNPELSPLVVEVANRVSTSGLLQFLALAGHYLSLETCYGMALACAEADPASTIRGIRGLNLTQKQQYLLVEKCARAANSCACIKDIEGCLENFDFSKKQKCDVRRAYPFMLNYSSVLQCIGQDATQAVVYGFASTRYLRVLDALQETESPLHKVFDYHIGKKGFVTDDGDSIDPFPIDTPTDGDFWAEGVARKCKAGVTNLILANFMRQMDGRPLIPLIFCIESPCTLEDRKLTVRSLTTKEKLENGLFTNRELRRVYKHCKDLEDDSTPVARELASVAARTLKLVRLTIEEGQHVMSLVSPVWEQPEWKMAWQTRMQQKSPEQHLDERSAKQFYWRTELVTRASSYRSKSQET